MKLGVITLPGFIMDFDAYQRGRRDTSDYAHTDVKIDRKN